jgi:RNA polymerase-interacting CarD/CdnL/TRCF family regulator
MSAEYSVQSIEAMLPTILAKEQYHRSVQSEKAAAEIVNMLYAYANVSGTSSKAQASARNSAEQIKSVSGNAGQILEIAHDLWTQYRKREGQPSDQFIN